MYIDNLTLVGILTALITTVFLVMTIRQTVDSTVQNPWNDHHPIKR